MFWLFKNLMKIILERPKSPKFSPAALLNGVESAHTSNLQTFDALQIRGNVGGPSPHESPSFLPALIADIVWHR